MKAMGKIILFFWILTGMGFYFGGCVHEPDILNPNQGNNSTDTTSVDTTSNPCNPDIVYFDQQILPLLLSGCAISGCHDPISKEDGVVLNSFENVIRTGGIKSFNPGGSKLYRKITTGEIKDRMPPPPMSSLSSDQLQIISKWISQGASNLSCNSLKSCDTSSVSFSKDIFPMINTRCKICHSGTSPSGNINLTSYTEIKNFAVSGKLACVVNWNTGCIPMPNGGSKLDVCSIRKIEIWIQQGSLNN